MQESDFMLFFCFRPNFLVGLLLCVAIRFFSKLQRWPRIPEALQPLLQRPTPTAGAPHLHFGGVLGQGLVAWSSAVRGSEGQAVCLGVKKLPTTPIFLDKGAGCPSGHVTLCEHCGTNNGPIHADMHIYIYIYI